MVIELDPTESLAGTLYLTPFGIFIGIFINSGYKAGNKIFVKISTELSFLQQIMKLNCYYFWA